MRSHTDDDDPLAAALRPPPDESTEARAIRIAREEEARRVSQAIDESIRVERQTNKKFKIVRVLLLGQSESGKSTTLRQFQRIYTPTAFHEERIHWRVIIQLNIIRSIHTILATLATHRRQTTRTRTRWDSRSQVASVRTDGKGKGKARAETLSDFEDDEDERFGDAAAHSVYTDVCSSEDIREDAELDGIAYRLESLQHVETILKERLVPPSENEPADLGNGPVGFTTSALGLAKEIFVRPGRWRSGGSGARPATAVASEAADEAQRVLFESRFDLMRLWESMRMREILALRRVRPEEESGFFLDDLERVTEYNYVPSDDDVLRARLKTIGVSEYKFEMEEGDQRGRQWRIVDVGGSRFQRPTWVPFFDNVDAIIFLAPISAFDQVLTEDPKVNRLEDSVLLWKGICQNKLLARVDLVLFLNKCDILQRKLESGIRLARYVKSYDDRPNDIESASKYFRTKFSAIQRTYSPVPRKFYGYCTSITEKTTAAGILASVRDIVLRRNLRSVRLA